MIPRCFPTLNCCLRKTAVPLATAIAQQSGNRENEGYALANLGQVKMSLGMFDDALECLKQALSLMDTDRQS